MSNLWISLLAYAIAPGHAIAVAFIYSIYSMGLTVCSNIFTDVVSASRYNIWHMLYTYSPGHALAKVPSKIVLTARFVYCLGKHLACQLYLLVLLTIADEFGLALMKWRRVSNKWWWFTHGFPPFFFRILQVKKQDSSYMVLRDSREKEHLTSSSGDLEKSYSSNGNVSTQRW